MSIEFINWLDAQMSERGMSQRELARRSGVSAGAINHVLSGKRNPGEILCRKIAKGLNLAPEIVMRAAGMLPQVPRPAADLEEWREILSYLSDEEREDLKAYGWLKVDRKRQAELRKQMDKKGG